jgi:hypothetical protein
LLIETPAGRSNLWLRVAVVAVSAAVSLTAAETALRACACARLGLGIPGTTGVLPFPDHPAGGFRFHYNALGDRTYESSARTGADDSWCVVGDSHANGIGVDDRDRLSEGLERSLGTRGRHIIVFNLAWPGTTLPHYESMMRRCASIYGARTIIAVVYLGNDLIELADWIDYGQPPVSTVSHETTWTEGIKKPLRRSFVFDAAAFVWANLGFRRQRPARPQDHLQAFYQAEFYMANPSREASDLEIFDRELQGMRRVANDARARLLVVAVPSWLQNDGTLDDSERARFEVALERRAADRMSRSGFDFIDLAPVLAADRNEPKFWPVDRHLSTRGHAIVAEALVRHVDAEKTPMIHP